MKNKTEFLKKADLFKHLTDIQLDKLAHKAEIEHHSKNHLIYLTGEKANYIYFIIEGWVKLFRTSIDGEESIIKIAPRNNTFGDIASLGRSNYPISAQATTDVKLLKMHYNDFIEIIRGDVRSLDMMFQVQSQRQLYLTQEIERLITCSANERIGLFLIDLLDNKDISKVYGNGSATIQLPYTKSLVANQLGMQSETFSRAFSKLKKQNLIDSSQRNITINNVKNLEIYCKMNEVTFINY